MPDTGERLGHYEILDRLGAGGMGEVYRARDTRLDRPVAIKMISQDLQRDPNAMERFLREARAVSALNHPNICTIHDIGDHDGRVFIVLECMSGRTLEAELVTGPLDLPTLLDFALQLTEGLEAAHATGIIHRDLKPANIFVVAKRRVKILDFGLAKIVGPGAPDGDNTMDSTRMDRTLTPVGVVAGTLRYMSPEQALGQEIDARTDLFSLGVVLYEMAAGRPPFSGATPAAMYDDLLNASPPPPSRLNPDCPQELDRIVLKLMEKQRDLRYQSIADLRADLRGLAQRTQQRGETTAAEQPISRIERGRRALARHDWETAFVAFREADEAGELEAEDLERLGQAAGWISRVDVFLEALERAHAMYVQADQRASAARVAVELAEDYAGMNKLSVSNGWLKRAESMLRDLPESVETGYLTRFKARMAIERDGDLDEGLLLAQETLRIAERFQHADLRALALQDRGRILVLKNDAEAGLALIDETMAASLGGELSPNTMGRVFCNMISTCEAVGDYRRAAEWSDRAMRWCRDHRESPYPGVCCVLRAELMSARGDWEAAEAQADRAATDHEKWFVPVAARAFYLLGEIKRRRGSQAPAEIAFLKAHELGCDPVPGLAQLRLDQGKVDAARSLIDRAIDGAREKPLDRLRLLPAGVEIALAAGDVPSARAWADELRSLSEKHDSPLFRGSAVQAAGAVMLAEDRIEDALKTFPQAAALWRDADMPYDEARTRVLLALAYWKAEKPGLADLEARSARSVFERLGAIDVKTVDELISRHA